MRGRPATVTSPTRGRSEQTPVWVTAQAITGMRRATYPIAPLKRTPGANGGSGGGQAGGGSGGGAGSGGGQAGAGSGGGVGLAAEQGSGGAGGQRDGKGKDRGGGPAKAGGGPGATATGGRTGVPRRSRPGAVAAVAAPEETASGDDDGSPVLLGFGLANLLGAAALGGWIGRQTGLV